MLELLCFLCSLAQLAAFLMKEGQSLGGVVDLRRVLSTGAAGQAPAKVIALVA